MEQQPQDKETVAIEKRIQRRQALIAAATAGSTSTSAASGGTTTAMRGHISGSGSEQQQQDDESRQGSSSLNLRAIEIDKRRAWRLAQLQSMGEEESQPMDDDSSATAAASSSASSSSAATGGGTATLAQYSDKAELQQPLYNSMEQQMQHQNNGPRKKVYFDKRMKEIQKRREWRQVQMQLQQLHLRQPECMDAESQRTEDPSATETTSSASTEPQPQETNHFAGQETDMDMEQQPQQQQDDDWSGEGPFSLRWKEIEKRRKWRLALLQSLGEESQPTEDQNAAATTSSTSSSGAQ